MSLFRCPICHAPLKRMDRVLRCGQGHSFDMARSGYVNLLCSQQAKSKRHGDDKRMLLARRAFLESGAYAPLKDLLCVTVRREMEESATVLDAGCGEGYYTSALARAFPNMTFCGVDISKDAVTMTASRKDAVELSVASVFALPIADATLSGVVSVFAPCPDEEFSRVLKTGGVLIRVIPTEQHLMGLKEALYKEARPNKPEKTEVAGFTLRHRQEIDWTLNLNSSQEIRDLFEMTPYFYKTGQEDQQRLLSRDYLETEVAFAILTYEKQ